MSADANRSSDIVLSCCRIAVGLIPIVSRTLGSVSGMMVAAFARRWRDHVVYNLMMLMLLAISDSDFYLLCDEQLFLAVWHQCMSSRC